MYDEAADVKLTEQVSPPTQNQIKDRFLPLQSTIEEEFTPFFNQPGQNHHSD